jgi:hypothetical protein
VALEDTRLMASLSEGLVRVRVKVRFRARARARV